MSRPLRRRSYPRPCVSPGDRPGQLSRDVPVAKLGSPTLRPSRAPSKCSLLAWPACLVLLSQVLALPSPAHCARALLSSAGSGLPMPNQGNPEPSTDGPRPGSNSSKPGIDLTKTGNGLSTPGSASSNTGSNNFKLQSSFLDDFFFTWGHQLVQDDGTALLSILDKANQGGGWSSKQPFYHGIFKAMLKAPASPSCGVVTAFYLTSEWNTSWPRDLHDEVDFELLGGHNPGEYELQTNYFLKGIGGHEERTRLWFDPSLDFHEYKFVVSKSFVRWFVDAILIREITKETHNGILPTTSLFLASSLWDGAYWVPCTLGQPQEKRALDWSRVPYYAHFRNVTIEGCYWRRMVSLTQKECAEPNKWFRWDADLGPKDRQVMRHLHAHYRTFYHRNKPDLLQLESRKESPSSDQQITDGTPAGSNAPARGATT